MLCRITTRIVLGVFEQEHFEKEWQSTGQQWTVTLNQLLRAVLGYPGWTVPTNVVDVAVEGVQQTTKLVTGATQDGRSTLSAFPDHEALAARAEHEGAPLGTVLSVPMTAQELLVHWHNSLDKETKIVRPRVFARVCTQ